MPRKQSQPTDRWASRLDAEMQKADLPPSGGLTFTQIKELRRARGLTYGDAQTHRWLREERKAGRLSRIDGYYRQSDGAKERKVYYILQ